MEMEFNPRIDQPMLESSFFPPSPSEVERLRTRVATLESRVVALEGERHNLVKCLRYAIQTLDAGFLFGWRYEVREQLAGIYNNFAREI